MKVNTDLNKVIRAGGRVRREQIESSAESGIIFLVCCVLASIVLLITIIK